MDNKVKGSKLTAAIYALAAACFYAINIPLSKLLLDSVSPTVMAALLYLGAGLGVGIMYLFHFKNMVIPLNHQRAYSDR